MPYRVVRAMHFETPTEPDRLELQLVDVEMARQREIQPETHVCHLPTFDRDHVMLMAKDFPGVYILRGGEPQVW